MNRGRIVLLQGKLDGLGHEAQCELLAREIAADAAFGKCPYSDFAVLTSSPTLPDGEYTVFFEGYFATAKRQRGHWVSVGVPQHA